MKTEGMLKTLGRRKEAVAQVRVMPGTGKIVINGRAVGDYFTVPELLHIVSSAQKAVGQDATIDVSVLVKGGGIRGQAEAVRLGIARALITMNEAYRPTLRKMGYLTRDARVKERKKYGLKSARRAPQFSKR
ncbi:30S ribosomal protein S9 [Patescibacteria group bacterium]|nr:MAG: 30S ribosomal protein S9 [Patescibacteria group bacterium]